MLTLEVAHSIEEVAAEFGTPTLREDGSGGAFVTIPVVPLGGPWLQPESWIGFQIGFQYPISDVYPHFVRRDLARADGKPLGDALSPSKFDGRDAIQVSRRSNRHDGPRQTAAMKLHKVLDWLRSRT